MASKGKRQDDEQFGMHGNPSAGSSRQGRRGRDRVRKDSSARTTPLVRRGRRVPAAPISERWAAQGHRPASLPDPLPDPGYVGIAAQGPLRRGLISRGFGAVSPAEDRPSPVVFSWLCLRPCAPEGGGFERSRPPCGRASAGRGRCGSLPRIRYRAARSPRPAAGSARSGLGAFRCRRMLRRRLFTGRRACPRASSRTDTRFTEAVHSARF